MALNQKQKNLYERNIVLPEIGEAGQEKLLKSRVLVIGAGGLGSSVLNYLVASGIGNIGIVDHDVVELSNLQRQVLHNTKNIGQKKVESAQEKILLLNPEINLQIFAQRATYSSLTEICSNYDFIVDATDNFASRFIINEVAHQQRKTLIFAAVKGFAGHLSVFKSYENANPCYACFNPNFVDENFVLPLSEKGILGAVAGTIGALQAVATIKQILEISETLIGKILIFDFLTNNFRKVVLRKNPSCKICKR